MLATAPRALQFPGVIPALLTWANGECERLPALITSAQAEATTLLTTLAAAVHDRDTHRTRAAAHRLHAVLAPFGVPQLSATAAMLEDLAGSREFGPTGCLLDDLGALLPALWAYLAKNPWLRC